MDHEEYLVNKRGELTSVARLMLSGGIDLIDGIRKINSLRFEIGDPDNVVFLAIRGLESETDHFPLGSMRSNCHPDYLEKMDAEMKDYMVEARENIRDACQEILKTYS